MLETCNYIAGNWRDGAGTVANHDPSDLDDLIGHFAQADTADLDRAVDAAIGVVNDTRFGLTSGIVTRSPARATHFRRNARTGCVMVNLATAGTDYHVPFGGRGMSSCGPREPGQYAKELHTTVKTAYVSAGSPS